MLLPDDLDSPSDLQSRAWTDVMIEAFDAQILWDAYGIVADVVVGFH